MRDISIDFIKLQKEIYSNEYTDILQQEIKYVINDEKKNEVGIKN